MARLLDTDVWFKTLRVRQDAQFTYYLSPNDSLVPDPQRKDKEFDTLQPDPLNPRRLVLRHPDRDWVTSLVELPGAPLFPWREARPDVRKGRTEEHRLSSKILGNERHFWVYTPPGYAPQGKPYDLLVLVDSWPYAPMLPTATIIDNLVAAGKIHPFVAVMVEPKDHSLELSCYEPFNEFLVRELIPWVREHFKVTTNAAETTVGGWDLGGVAAAFAVLRHPEIFGSVFSQSGDFSWDPREAQTVDKEDLEYEWVIRQYAASPKLPLRFTFTVGVFERDHKYPDRPSLLQANRHMRDVLLAKGYSVNYREVAGGHEVSIVAFTLPDGLMSLVGTSAPDKIAFDTNRDGHMEVYVMDPDGTNQRRLTHTLGGEHKHSWMPSWSPDRKNIIFRSNRDGNWEIYVMGADGSNVHQLTHTPGKNKENGNPDWSPDGKTIAFDSDRDGKWEIYLMNADGSDVRQLTHTSGDGWENGNPDWSPDGKQIVFASGQPPDWSEDEIYVMDANGSAIRRLTHTPGKGNWTPRWAPDKTRIVFASNRNGTLSVPPDADIDVYVMDADGSNVRQLTIHERADRPHWSPDGKRIVFMSKRDCRAATIKECQFQAELYVMDADGSKMKRLTHNEYHDGHPAW